MNEKNLSEEEKLRYNRHLILPEIGEEGQVKMKQAKVLVVGAGGLGAPILQYLTAAGIGTIGISDYDNIDLTNLQRQVLFGLDDVGESKVQVAIKKLSFNNPSTQFNQEEAIKKESALEVIKRYDIVVDGSDNFATKYLVNDACIIMGKPLVYGSIYRFSGHVGVFNYLLKNIRTGNYRDIFPEQPEASSMPSCAEAGVLGVLPGIIGSLQANEVIKIAAGIGEPLTNRLLIFDALKMVFKEFTYGTNEENQNIKELGDYEDVCDDQPIKEISVAELKSWIKEKRNFQLIDVREKEEYENFNVGGTLLPLNSIEESVNTINKEIPVAMICQSGKRSEYAIQNLQDKYGYNNLYNVLGGINGWETN